MPDTGAPWNIPYFENADLVSDWPADSLLVANAVAAGLSAAGGLVAVKNALFTGTQSNSTAAGANFAVTSLSITHTLADASNKLILIAHIGVNGHSNGSRFPAFAFASDGTLIGVGGADGSRIRVASGGKSSILVGVGDVGIPQAITLVTLPNDTSSHVYTVRGINVDNATTTVYVNRSGNDANDAFTARGSSSFILMEVKV